ncbi:MAG TPA: type II secretion system F family protein [Actinopolymorphaceae bacterium]|nr:type II secretion system F family protein [Actinopolymorphaceae bacterium]
MSVLAAASVALGAAAAALAGRGHPGAVLARVQGQSPHPSHRFVRVLGQPIRAFHLRRGGPKPRERRRAAAREACEIIAAELRAGRHPDRALEAAAAVFADLAPAVAVSRMGGDVSAALRAVPQIHAGAEDLSRLAVAWTVAETSGAGLAALVDRTASGLREEEAVRREVAAQLAGPRASARMLAGLPLLGVGLGMGVGTDPIGFLLHSPSGWACLGSASTLAAAGLAWVERLARRAESAS